MSLGEIRDGWNHAAREDAMFYIATHQGRENGGWTPEEFFALGLQEIDEVIDHLDMLELRGEARINALDFGCGIGRLTQALATYYDRAFGCDISEEMIKLANRHNRYGRRVMYLQNVESLLDTFSRDYFDLIYSRITLQHMPASLQRGYVTEFVQLLAPEGLAVFQIPEGPEYSHPKPWLSMHGVTRGMVEGWVDEAGGEMLDVEDLGMDSHWIAYRYTMRRK